MTSDNHWVKDSSKLVVHEAGGLETPYQTQHSYYTPNDAFFVCSKRTPEVDIDSYQLSSRETGSDNE